MSIFSQLLNRSDVFCFFSSALLVKRPFLDIPLLHSFDLYLHGFVFSWLSSTAYFPLSLSLQCFVELSYYIIYYTIRLFCLPQYNCIHLNRNALETSLECYRSCTSPLNIHIIILCETQSGFFEIAVGRCSAWRGDTWRRMEGFLGIIKVEIKKKKKGEQRFNRRCWLLWWWNCFLCKDKELL